MEKISFRTKILLSFVTILALALLLPSIYFRHELVSHIRLDAVAQAKKQLRIVSWVLDSNPEAFTIPSLNARFAEIKNTFDLRVTYVDGNGRVLADSDVAPEAIDTLENHASRPEIAQAMTRPQGISIRYSGTLGKNLIYLARSIHLPGLEPGTLRISRPYSMVQELVDRMTSNFLGILALTLLIIVGLTTLFANQLTKSITHLVSMAISIGEGEYSKRIRTSPGKEFEPLLTAVNHMAARIQTNIRTITSQKVELEAILNGMNEGVMALGASGNILKWNRSMETIFPEILNKRGHRPIEAVRIPELEIACQTLVNSPDKNPRPVTLQLKTNDDSYYDVNIVPTGKDEPKMIVVFHDITEIKRVETVRRDFVANVSHELRTPLTSIKGYTETLLSMDACKAPNVEEFLTIVLKHTDAMARILNDLLSLARIEVQSENTGLPEPVQAKAALATALKSIAPLLETKGISLTTRLPEKECSVLGTTAQIEQVFKNLLENAIKYAPAEKGTIEIRSFEQEDSCLFEIEDNGPGIPSLDQERIFERFYRVEKDRNSKIPGTGLGLAICKHIISRHGGTIRVTSPVKDSGGSCFSFTLKKA